MATPSAVETPRATTVHHNPNLPYFACQPTDASFFTSAEVRNVYTVTLPISPARLFEVFEDPTSWPRWAPGIGKVIWTSPKPYGVGTTRTVVFWGGMEVYEIFVKWQPEREMAFILEATTQLVWHRFGEHYTVEDLGDGRCQLTWTVCYEPASVFKRIHFFAGWLMKVNLGTYMWWLKRYCRKLS